jgi:YegS/Rv2252/BmrU family lipid kinase
MISNKLGISDLANFKFIVNPAAARGKCAQVGEALTNLCQERGMDFDIQFTNGPQEAIEIAQNATENFECIVAVGGDGTVHEVVNGIMGKKVKFGILPVGTGNDFIKATGIPLRIVAALDTVLALNTRKIDVGKAGDLYFPNGFGIGFDAWVVQASLNVRKLRGKAIYLYSVLKTIYNYKTPVMHYNYDDVDHEGRIFMLTVGNGTSLGGGFKLTPFAQVDDGLLDLTIIRDLKKWEIYQNLIGVYFGKHVNLPQVKVGKTKKIKIESNEGFAAHADGELLSLNIRSLEISIVPKSLELIVPKT